MKNVNSQNSTFGSGTTSRQKLPMQEVHVESSEAVKQQERNMEDGNRDIIELSFFIFSKIFWKTKRNGGKKV